jgi:hypothetical protein
MRGLLPIGLTALLVLAAAQVEQAPKTFALLTLKDISPTRPAESHLAGESYDSPAEPVPQQKVILPPQQADAPKVILESPSRDEFVTEPFVLKLRFESEGDSSIDLKSVSIVYGRSTSLNDRLKDHIKRDGIEILNATAPPGDHPITVLIKDTEGRVGALSFGLKVRN